MLAGLRALQVRPEFDESYKEKYMPSSKPLKVPKKSNLDKTLFAISENGWVGRQTLRGATGLSFSCLDRCLRHLASEGKITRKAVKRAGLSDVCVYNVTGLIS